MTAEEREELARQRKARNKETYGGKLGKWEITESPTKWRHFIKDHCIICEAPLSLDEERYKAKGNFCELCIRGVDRRIEKSKREAFEKIKQIREFRNAST